MPMIFLRGWGGVRSRSARDLAVGSPCQPLWGALRMVTRQQSVRRRESLLKGRHDARLQITIDELARIGAEAAAGQGAGSGRRRATAGIAASGASAGLEAGSRGSDAGCQSSFGESMTICGFANQNSNTFAEFFTELLLRLSVHRDRVF